MIFCTNNLNDQRLTHHLDNSIVERESKKKKKMVCILCFYFHFLIYVYIYIFFFFLNRVGGGARFTETFYNSSSIMKSDDSILRCWDRRLKEGWGNFFFFFLTSHLSLLHDVSMYSQTSTLLIKCGTCDK